MMAMLPFFMALCYLLGVGQSSAARAVVL